MQRQTIELPNFFSPPQRRLRALYSLLSVLCWLFWSAQQPVVLAQTPTTPNQLSVVIELREPALTEVYAQMSNQNLVSSAALTAATQAQLAVVEAAQQRLLGELEQFDAQVIFRNLRVYNGVAVRVAADALTQLARLPDVKAIHPLIAKTPANARGAALIGAPYLWQNTASGTLTGAGMTIAIIDTGIDYLHTDLGGPGSGYAQNDPTVITDVVGFPNLKVIDGHDFTGNLYNANPEDGNFNPTLAPDRDPMDCYPHGTAVASTAAGSGVNANGSSYNGPYGLETPLNTLRIGPGVAPAAKLYALKVFGCTGSSEVVDQAIEWAIDPNGDGDLSDHVDVINLSLGSDYGSPYDLTTLACDRAAALGVIVVAAAGNAGDHYYISSSPANANFALSVAASQPIYHTPQGVEQLLYETMAGFSSRGPRRIDAALKPDLTAPGVNVVTAGQGTGNNVRIISGTSLATPFVAGSMALLRQRYPAWSVTELKALVMNTALTHLRLSEAITSGTYSPVRVGAGRIDLVRALQAQGVAYNADDPGLISVSFGAPQVYTSSVVSKAVALVNKSPFPLTYTLEYIAVSDQPGVAITQPTGTISVAASAAITFPMTMTAEATALQRPRDPTVSPTEAGFARDWLSEEAGYLLFWPAPLTLTVQLTPTQALANGGLAAPSAVTGQGIFTYTPASHTLSYTLQVNQLVSAVTALQLVYGQTEELAYTLFNGSSPVADPVTLSGAVTLAAKDGLPLADGGLALKVLTVDRPDGAAHGPVQMAAPVLKVPIYAAPRPASTVHVITPALDFAVSQQPTATLTFTGTGLSSPDPLIGVQSLLSVAMLQATSPRLTISEPLPVLQHVGYADLRYVGSSSYLNPTQNGGDPVANSTINFAIAVYEPWSSPNEVEVEVYIDVDRDGKDDFVLYNSDQVGYNSKRSGDSFISVLKNLKSGVQSRQAYLNGVSPAASATGLYDNQVMVLPVQAMALGLTQTQARFTYHVETYSNDSLYRLNGQKRLIDQTGRLSYDVGQPGLIFTPRLGSGLPPYVDGPQNVVQVDFALGAYAAAGGQGILLLHHHNGIDATAEVVPIRYQWSNWFYLPAILR